MEVADTHTLARLFSELHMADALQPLFQARCIADEALHQRHVQVVLPSSLSPNSSFWLQSRLCQRVQAGQPQHMRQVAVEVCAYLDTLKVRTHTKLLALKLKQMSGAGVRQLMSFRLHLHQPGVKSCP